jgi:hypothetical protein
MAGCQGAGDDRGVSSSRWGKAQARWQTHNRGTLDFTRSEGWEHCGTPDWKGEEKKRAIDIDQPNVNYKNTTTGLEDIRCLDSSLTAGTTWKR